MSSAGDKSCHCRVRYLLFHQFFDLIILSYMDSLNKIRNLFYITVHEEKNALIKDISWVNRIHLTILISVENIYIWCIALLRSRVLKCVRSSYSHCHDRDLDQGSRSYENFTAELSHLIPLLNKCVQNPL